MDRARELYENGVSLYEEGAYEAAALAFLRAYELSEDTNALFNIVLAYDRLGQFERAIEYLDRYRALAPQAERAQLERRKKSLVTRLDKQREAQALAEAQAEAHAQAHAKPPPSDVADRANDEPLPEDPPPPAHVDRRFPPLAWTLTGAAAVGFGLGLGFGVSSLANSQTGKEGCTEASDGRLCQSSAGADLQRSRRYAIVADVGFALGATATVGTVIVVVLAARRRKAKTSAAIPIAIPGGAGIALARRF